VQVVFSAMLRRPLGLPQQENSRAGALPSKPKDFWFVMPLKRKQAGQSQAFTPGDRQQSVNQLSGIHRKRGAMILLLDRCVTDYLFVILVARNLRNPVAVATRTDMRANRNRYWSMKDAGSDRGNSDGSDQAL
jgi:hypothetical protein